MTFKQLQVIQNAAARVLMKTRRTEHITPILRSLHWLPVSHRIDFKALLFMSHYDMFQQYTPARPLRSQEKNLLVIPTVRPKHGKAASLLLSSGTNFQMT